ncbi:MAG: hypothetical protein ACO3A2_09985, partial [Bdellovibrionia bacterium]
ISVLTLSASLSLGELGAVSFFSSERTQTLPLLIARWNQQYRFEEAQALCALLLALAVGVILLGLRRPS